HPRAGGAAGRPGAPVPRARQPARPHRDACLRAWRSRPPGPQRVGPQGNDPPGDRWALDLVAADDEAGRRRGDRGARLAGRLDQRQVVLPAPLVDIVVETPDQWQSYAAEYDPELFEPHAPASAQPVPDPVRAIIAGRAALEVPPGAVLNLGFGMSAQVVDVL